MLTCSLSAFTKVPSLHSYMLENCSIFGILWCIYGDSLFFILLSQIKLWGSNGTQPKLLCNLRWSSKILSASLHASLLFQTKGPNWFLILIVLSFWLCENEPSLNLLFVWNIPMQTVSLERILVTWKGKAHTHISWFLYNSVINTSHLFYTA